MDERPAEGLLSGANLAHLLGRPPRNIPTKDGESQLAGARVLVTGAGGSVGSAVVARLSQLHADRIIAVDHHEASLFRLGRDVAPGGPVQLRLADVRNGPKIRRILDEARPSIVIHLAAYKHVPFGEYEPDEAVSVNVLGTREVATAAIAAGVRHVIYPSSDKAVNPPSLYGATKRLAETVLLALAAAQPGPAIHVVRYVNIVGTSGSVLETFLRQAPSGAPLTLTDPRMTRYWMGMDEAIALLWHALALPTGSRTLLDVGEPISVKTMAERVCALVHGPDASPRFVVTGSRPGERLAEELVSQSETLVACGEEPVWRVVYGRSAEIAPEVPGVVDEIRALLDAADNFRLRARVMELAHRFQ